MRDEPTHQPSRVLTGHCPECRRVVVLFNNYEVWPLIKCECGWRGATDRIDNSTRLERGGVIFDVYNLRCPLYLTLVRCPP